MFKTLAVITVLSVPSFAAAQHVDDAKAREDFKRLVELAKPGPEHKQLKTLTGQWKASILMRDKDTGFVGTAIASTILDDRFLVIDGTGSTGNRKSAFRYTIGFDRRNSEYVIILMDTSGTYHVTGRGKPTEGSIQVFGTDNDPHMKSLGFEKKFGFELEIKSADEFSITTIFVDNRTKEEKLMPTFRHVFTRTDPR